MDDIVRDQIVRALKDERVREQLGFQDEIMHALSDPQVKQLLQASISQIDMRAELAAAMSDPEVKQTIYANLLGDELRQEVRSAIDLPTELQVALANPEVRQMLGAQLSTIAASENLLSELDIGNVLADPAVKEQVLTQMRHELANDGPSLDHATLVAGVGIYSALAVVMYAMLAASCLVSVGAFLVYLGAFVTTSTFQCIWLHVLHLPLCALGVTLARGIPAPHAVIKAVASGAGCGVGADAPGTPDTPVSPLIPLLDPLVPLVGRTAVVWAACIVTDLAAVLACLLIAWSTVEAEQAALAVLLVVTATFVLLDLAPLALWPLLRWALPPTHRAAIEQTASKTLAALGATAKASFTASLARVQGGQKAQKEPILGAFGGAPPKSDDMPGDPPPSGPRWRPSNPPPPPPLPPAPPRDASAADGEAQANPFGATADERAKRDSLLVFNKC